MLVPVDARFSWQQINWSRHPFLVFSNGRSTCTYIVDHANLNCSWIFFLAGYGHLTPVTTYGKLFCIVFCLFGIPVCLLTLKTAGELISRFLTCVVTRFERKVLKNKDVRHVEIKCTMLAVTVMALYLSLSAAVQVIWEKWSFLDAFYAWFVAFSTIGFGDYIPFDSVVPRKDKHGITAAIFHVVATFPALFGLAIVASVMNSVFVVFDKYRLHTAALNCHCSRRNRKRNSKDRVKLSFAKLDAVDDRSRGRSHSV